MIAAHQYLYFIILDAINQTMLRGDSSRPETTQVMFEGFRLSHAVERVSLYGLDQEIDALEPGFVVLLKPEVVVQPSGVKSIFILQSTALAWLCLLVSC